MNINKQNQFAKPLPVITSKLLKSQIKQSNMTFETRKIMIDIHENPLKYEKNQEIKILQKKAEKIWMIIQQKKKSLEQKKILIKEREMRIKQRQIRIKQYEEEYERITAEIDEDQSINSQQKSGKSIIETIDNSSNKSQHQENYAYKNQNDQYYQQHITSQEQQSLQRIEEYSISLSEAKQTIFSSQGEITSHYFINQSLTTKF